MKRIQILIFLTIIIVVAALTIHTFFRLKKNHSKQTIADTITSSTFRPVSPRMNKVYDSNKVELRHPFIIYNDGSFLIACEIETSALIAEYQPIFDQYGLSGNGYCWEGIIRQILKRGQKDLLNHIDFDPEAGGFYAYADSRKAQYEFVDYLAPIFNDHEKLKQALKTIDLTQIVD